MTAEASATRRYLAVFLPFLSAERAMRANAAPHDAPFALTEKIGGAMRLAAVDRSAKAIGITPGLTLRDARTRVPDLASIAHDPVADLSLLDWLADACDRYSPAVATAPPSAIILDITGCTHDYGGEDGLTCDLHQRFERQGLSLTTAIADTPDAALALATFGGDQIAALPVAALRVDAEVQHALRRAGLKTLGALARTPRGLLEARFGTAATASLARLLGEADLRLTPRRHPPAIVVETRFAEPVVQTDAALAALDSLMRQVAAILASRGVGGRRFTAALFRSDGHVARLDVDTGAPTRDATVIARLFRERIDTLADPLDPGFGYDLIRLAVPVTDLLAPQQLQLDGGALAEVELAALIDRLTVRLGPNRVRRFASGDSHVPEQAAFDLPVGNASSVAWQTPDPGEPPLRPLHLFDPPQRIEAIAEVPDGPPFRFRWRRVLHEVRRAEGPERIAAEWWRRSNGKGLTRDYYRVEDQAGRRFWVFRHGLYGVEKATPAWYLHGLFA